MGKPRYRAFHPTGVAVSRKTHHERGGTKGASATPSSVMISVVANMVSEFSRGKRANLV